jgi:PKD repeat protein
LSYVIPVPLCEGTYITITSGNPNTFWFDGYNGQIKYINNDTSVYWADINTCNNCIKRDTIHLDFINYPNAVFSTSTSSLTATFNNTSTNATTYNWDFGDGNASTLSNPVHTYGSDATYTVTLIASNVCGSDTTSFVVNIYTTSIQGSETNNIHIHPSILSKNGTIKITGLSKPESHYEIYNTLGQSVISGNVSSDYTIILSQEVSGIFYLVIDSQEKRFFHKIIVQ